jgi:AcrR family transcriptional regulator
MYSFGKESSKDAGAGPAPGQSPATARAAEAAEPELPHLSGYSESLTDYRLLESAAKLFGEQGFHATTTRDVCSRIGLSSAALYVHFPSKEAVLFELMRIGHLAAIRTVREAVANVRQDEPTEVLRASVCSFILFETKYHNLHRICQYELTHLSSEHYEVIANLRHEFTSLFDSIISEGLQKGEFAVNDIELTTICILSIGFDIARWFRPAGRFQPEVIANEFAELAVHVVRNTPKGTPA